ncbi:MAG: helix-turn-helix transcriptional regulator [Bacteroidales bacterium]|nr:helix-turn-helix transcriptional regulator [Bacteroidales bacterium]
MKDRIVKFLTKNGLSSTRFADEIGVQRSSISHILSGRNKPSFDFIEKMLLTYPNLNAQWLIVGKGSMFIDDGNTEKAGESDLFTSVNSIKDTAKPSEKLKFESIEEIDLEKIEEKLHVNSNHLIERIVLFFNNGLFKEYIPMK